MNRRRIALFPLPGAILFPGMHLPLHIFEPRYRAMIGEAMSRDQRIGMIQPSAQVADGAPPLFDVGCVGRMANIEALDDGRYNVLLEGVSRFTVLRELEVATPFRQAEVDFWEEREADEVLASVERAALEQEARAFASNAGYEVDWKAVERLDDYSFVNGVAQVIPFDAASKQALLEAEGLAVRAELLTRMMRFFSEGRGEGDGATLQ
jgi:Lon protease-like protein